jgi:predicted nucleotidyltransferase
MKRAARKARPVAPARGLADALFAKVQQRVLGVLFGNPHRSLYATEIIGLARSGTGAVQRELRRLEASGLVTVRRVGRQKHYQANAGSPVFAELRALVLKTSGMADVLRSTLAPLLPSIRAAFVYGSIAKGEDTAASDVDLMVISDRLTYGDLFAALEEASARLGRKVAPTIYSAKELARRVKRDNAFVTRVLGQPKLWLIGDERDLAEALHAGRCPTGGGGEGSPTLAARSRPSVALVGAAAANARRRPARAGWPPVTTHRVAIVPGQPWTPRGSGLRVANPRPGRA